MNDERRNADRIGFFLLGCAIGVAISTAIQITQVPICGENGGSATAIDNKVVCAGG